MKVSDFIANISIHMDIQKATAVRQLSTLLSYISTIGGKMKVRALFMVALLACGVAVADETTQREKIAKIIEAQGLTLMFQQQLDASKEAAGEIGRNIAKKLLTESGVPEGQQSPKVEQAIRRYMERCATMISAKELVDTWAAFYGKNLSDAELDQVLAYYQSPVGRKDVLATQVAMAGFSQKINTLGQERMNVSIGQLMSELKTAFEK